MSALYFLKIRLYNSLDPRCMNVSICVAKPETRVLLCNELLGSLESGFEP